MDEEDWKLTDTGMIKQSGDKKLKIFETKEGKSVFVDVQLLKPFGKDIGLYGNEKGEMVYIKGVLNFEGLVCVCIRSRRNNDKNRDFSRSREVCMQ